MRDLTLPTDPPPVRSLDIAEYKVITGPGGIPHGLVWLTCRRPGCDNRYVLPIDLDRCHLGWAAYDAGWTLHTSLGPVCPDHPAGTPVAALEASAEALNRSRQEVLETGEWEPVPPCDCPRSAPGFTHQPGCPHVLTSTELPADPETTVPDETTDEQGDEATTNGA